MNKDEYRLAITIMAQQKVLQFGTEKVFWFENAETKGIARFNLRGNRSDTVYMLLSSSDGGKVVGCLVRGSEGSPHAPNLSWSRSRRRFVFTIDNIADQEEIRRRILAAGIKPRGILDREPPSRVGSRDGISRRSCPRRTPALGSAGGHTHPHR